MKKTIFTGFRHYTENQDAPKKEAQDKVMDFLRRDYNLVLCSNIIKEGKPKIDEAVFMGTRFYAILSNVPPSGMSRTPIRNKEEEIEKFREGYKNTLDILREMSKLASEHNRKVPIIAYTSANPIFWSLFEAEGVRKLIYKSSVDNWQNEAREIKRHLDSLLA